MAKAITKPNVTVTVTIEINEEEARALDALAGYGAKTFIDCFYEKLGKAYLQPYEKGLLSFLSTIQSAVSPALNQVDDARKFIEKQ